MKRIVKLAALCIVFLFAFGSTFVSAETLFEQMHTITIHSSDETLMVSEIITVPLEDNLSQQSFFNIWVPYSAYNLVVTINDQPIQYEQEEDTIYLCNLSMVNTSLRSTLDVHIGYDLPQTTHVYSTTLLRNATHIQIQCNDQALGSFIALTKGSVLSVPLSLREEASPLTLYLLMVVLIILLVIVVLLLVSRKKRQTTQSRIRTMESKEVLQTEYDMLKEMLKQIEKYHRTEKISDDVYHKLKDHYKQQAIETMVALEKTGSHIDG